MKIDDNGILREVTGEEAPGYIRAAQEAERSYWTGVSYDELVNAEIRKQYSVSQEFAILRQKDRKTQEWTQYDQYCETCKKLVRAKLQEYGMEVTK